MKIIFSLMNGISSTVKQMRENVSYLEMESRLGSKDLEDIIKNPEDREKLDRTLQELRENKNKTKTVDFSDRTLEISIE
ncbi:hypothetical protein [Flavobacterium sp. NKUCC04_CG]|uniref:hypothetical protein n=1 Tax=Flavobacterium sp. NKUCC04_CG TaxID=2842121 RepID=UPI001C5AF02E|nr:hypothetical protein [Flavobacterium sp. NKUCC04_CG]MBW3519494.1 hypothetical protein [Flavobacterium sp. NKUCC04_CG]